MAATICLDHIGISVSDMDRAIRFFRHGLGADVSEPIVCDDPKMGSVVGIAGARSVICQARLGGAVFELLHYVEPVGRQVHERRPCDPGHVHLAIKVDDIEGVVERMRAHGFEPAGLERGLGGSGLAACYCYGFDGLTVELLKYPDPS